MDPAHGVTDESNLQFLREFLSERDTPCPACGYNLRNLAGIRCPECGEAIKIQVGMVEPKMAAAITGLIGLAAGAGLNGLLVIYGLIQIALRSMSDLARFFTITGIGLVVLGAAMALWLRWWRAIRRQSAGRKALLVLSAWTLTLVDLVIFSFAIK